MKLPNEFKLQITTTQFTELIKYEPFKEFEVEIITPKIIFDKNTYCFFLDEKRILCFSYFSAKIPPIESLNYSQIIRDLKLNELGI